MEIHFEKYQALGNNFILINQFERNIQLNNETISFLCDRNVGIGADGIIIIKKCLKADFEIVFHNPDGTKSLCGNGSICAVDFAIKKGFSRKNKSFFLAYDGYHYATYKNDKISIKMNNVSEIKKINDDYLINTGASHYVQIVKNLKKINIYKEVNNIKLNNDFNSKEFNINFVKIVDENEIEIRTFEKGVEAETQSCGTGAIAASIAVSFKNLKGPLKVKSRGGMMKAHFEKNKSIFENIFLEGTQRFIFSGKINIK